jgi:hypothetical protein
MLPHGPSMLTLFTPSLKLVLILFSLEVINETLKGHLEMGVEVEPSPFGEGNPEGSTNSK